MASIEQILAEISNDALRHECQYFQDISTRSQNSELRETFVKELNKVFSEADHSGDGEIDRQEFEKLIQGYFELKGIRSTKENFDKYFNTLDVNHDKSIAFDEFLQFSDGVNEK